MHKPTRTTQSRATLLWLTAYMLLMACATSGAHAKPGGARGQDAQLTDAAITRAVEQELDHDRAVDSPDITVSTEDGIVTLEGNVSNLMAQERAVRIAETVKGVRTVISRIAIRPTIELSDRALKYDVNSALFYDRATDAYELGVEVDQGTVKLTGQVQSFAERQLAERVAKTVHGVRAVDNHITIKLTGDRPRPEIKADVEKRLRWDEQPTFLAKSYHYLQVDAELDTALNDVWTEMLNA